MYEQFKKENLILFNISKKIITPITIAVFILQFYVPSTFSGEKNSYLIYCYDV